MHRIALSIIVALSLAGSPSLAQGPDVAKHSFLVFDGLLYQDKPDLAKLGMLPIRGINPPATANRPSEGVDDADIRATPQGFD